MKAINGQSSTIEDKNHANNEPQVESHGWPTPAIWAVSILGVVLLLVLLSVGLYFGYKLYQKMLKERVKKEKKILKKKATAKAAAATTLDVENEITKQVIKNIGTKGSTIIMPSERSRKAILVGAGKKKNRKPDYFLHDESISSESSI